MRLRYFVLCIFLVGTLLGIMSGFILVGCDCDYDHSPPPDPACEESTLGESYSDGESCHTCTYWDQPSEEPWPDGIGGIGNGPEYNFDSIVPLEECIEGICSAVACSVVVQ